MADRMDAYCGLRCDTCHIFLATKEADGEKKREMRAEIAQAIKEHYGRECTADDVADCDGCKAEGGRLFAGCHGCKIRECAMEKGVESCADCSEYPCETLNDK